ncbi:uncharacterized protein LOC116352404 [Contarinia nasturtii]|uniref:uncharacterized protein LOC116352404 n=1 Tax=Contarinia nasturtii TaxID=265458 RepID=UPI0012D464E9|nr:uncharacterized protein LOC116352404 [Contarinia nasturtii]
MEAPSTDTKTVKRRALHNINTIRKRCKFNNDNDKSQSTFISELNEYCIEEIFKWLSLDDLNSIGKTCKRLQQLAGQHFQRNYPRSFVKIWHGYPFMMGQNVDGLSEFIQSITIVGWYRKFPKQEYTIVDEQTETEQYHYIKSKLDRSLKQIKFDGCRLTKCKVNEIIPLLNGVKVIQMVECTVVDDLYDCLLKHCVNLERLLIGSTRFLSKCDWLRRKYPKLVHFQLIEEKPFTIKQEELLTFLQLNPNIRSFVAHCWDLEKCIDYLIESKVQLDELTIKNYNLMPTDILNTLHDSGFYKRINIFTTSDLNKATIAVNGVGMLKASIILEPGSDYSYLANVKELWPSWTARMIMRCAINFNFNINIIIDTNNNENVIYQTELVHVAKCMINLERIWLKYLKLINSCDILPFIKYSPKLKEIYIVDGYNYHENLLDLSTWNKERQKLGGACKITILIDDDCYFKTKLSSNSIDLSLITLKRQETYPLTHIDPLCFW